MSYGSEMACRAEARKRIVMPAFALRYGAAAFARHCVAGEGWWEVLVMLQSSLPTVVCDTGFTDRQPEHLPKLVAGVGVAPTEAELMRLV